MFNIFYTAPKYLQILYCLVLLKESIVEYECRINGLLDSKLDTIKVMTAECLLFAKSYQLNADLPTIHALYFIPVPHAVLFKFINLILICLILKNLLAWIKFQQLY